MQNDASMRDARVKRLQHKVMYSLRLDAELKAGLEMVKDRDGIPESELIRRALIAWFEQRGVSTRKRQRGHR
jgi:hypothetical protein